MTARARLEQAAKDLAVLAAAPLSELEKARVEGQREGVLLALDALDMERRDRWFADTRAALDAKAPSSIRGLFDTLISRCRGLQPISQGSPRHRVTKHNGPMRRSKG